MTQVDSNDLIIVVFGASGDLAAKKVYPAIWKLYKMSRLPKNVKIVGYARSPLTSDILMERVRESVHLLANKDTTFDEFCNNNYYIKGFYDKEDSFINLRTNLDDIGKNSNRIYYMALPPNLYECTSLLINQFCMQTTGWVRIIYEKPFGKDLTSSNHLSAYLTSLFDECHLYRMDHYLGKEILRNLLALRFGNRIFSAVWNRDHIKSVSVTFKEDFGVEGRSGYFDNYGIIRDVIQNHLLQIVTLIAMEMPKTIDSEAIREEKVKVLKHFKEAEISRTVTAQYLGYRNETGVAPNSRTPTFTSTVLYIDNDRWMDVPFIIEAGKESNERKCEIKIRFRATESGLLASGTNDELIISVGPTESICLRVLTKNPGEDERYVYTNLKMDYKSAFANYSVVDPYETLIRQAIEGNQGNFVRTDELEEAWRIFTPLLDALEREKIEPIVYERRSSGPSSADKLVDSL